MHMNRENLNIKAVSQLSGLSEHTIRAWERRYSAVAPARTDTGHRTYKMDDVERLKLLGVLVNQGHTIRMVANLPMDELKTLLTEHTQAIVRPPQGTESPATPIERHDQRAMVQAELDTIIQALLRFDLTSLGRQLAKARIRLDLRTFVFGICIPLMRAVGRKVNDGRVTISQEHALSSLLADQLKQMLQVLNEGNADKSGPYRMVLASPEGDFHEFGILLSAILAASNGWCIQYLGPNLPAKDLAEAVNRLGAPVVLVGTADISESELKQPWQAYFTELERGLPSSSHLWIGGAAAEHHRRIRLRSERHLRYIQNIEELEQLLLINPPAAAL